MISNIKYTFHLTENCRLVKYGCRNGAKFSILKFYSYSTFFHSYSPFIYSHSTFVCSYSAFVYYIQHLFIRIQHLFIHIQHLFIHIQHLFIHIQHLCVISISIYSSSTFMLNNYIHSKFNICILFLILSIQRFLSIQQFFIHSRFTAHLSYAWK